jgi:hypothetical protein
MLSILNDYWLYNWEAEKLIKFALNN